MSTKEYDDRIVRMGFDNAKFESNAAKTMSTLDKLNEKLKLKGASEGSSNIQKEVNSIDFSSLERAIARIESRFSTMGIVGMNVINKITDGIAGSVKQLEAATIGQIKSGGWNRAMNIANAKFQIEGLGFAWEEVEKAVSYGVKDTAYGLDAAASAASQLAASGVDFKKTLETVNGQDLTAMHKSLRAISGVAAMTNSSYEDIARIFTTVAGNGRLMGDQLLQLSSRGMNAAAKLAEVMNTTEEAVRDMVSKGQIDFQTFAFAMDNAFGEHAKEANKTFTGALGNMKAALSRVGEIFASPIINKTNTLFISLTARIDEFKNKLKSVKVPRSLEEIKKQYGDIAMNATAYEQILKGIGDRTVTFGDHFAEMWQSGIDAFSAMTKAIDINWFDKIVEKVDSVTVKIKDFFDLIKEIYSDSAEEAADGIKDATETLLVSAEEAQAAKDIILKGMYGSGQKRVDALTEMFGGGDVGAKHAKNVQAYVDSVVAAGWDFEKASIKVEDASETAAKAQGKAARDVKKAKIKAVIDNVTGALSDLWTTTKNIGKAIGKIIKPIIEAFASVFNIKIESISSKTKSLTKFIANISEKLIVSDKTAGKIKNVFTKIFTVVKSTWDKIKALFNAISPYITAGIEKVKKFISAVQDSKLFTVIKNLFSTIYDALTGQDTKTLSKSPLLSSIKEIIDSMKNVSDENKDTPKTFTDFINNIIDSIMGIKWSEVAKIGLAGGAVLAITDFIDSVKTLGSVITGIAKIPKSISEFFENMGDAVESVGNVLEIASVAGSLAIVALSLVVLSTIPEDQLYKSVGVMLIIAAIIRYLIGASVKLMEGQATLKKTVASVSTILSSVKAFASIATMFLAFSGSIAILAAAMAIIKQSGATSGDEFMLVAGLMFILMLVGIAIAKMVESIDAKKLTKATAVMASMAALFVAAGISVLAMSGGIALMSTVSTDTFGLVLTLLGVMIAGLAVIMNMATDIKPANALASAVTISAIGAAMSAIMLAVAGACAIITSAATLITTTGVNTDAYILIFGSIFALFLAVIFLVNKAESIDSIPKVVATLLAMSVTMNAIGSAVLLMALALGLITKIGMDEVDGALLVLGTILGGLVVLMYMATALKPTQMLASAVMFVGISAAVATLAGAIILLSQFGSEQMLTAAGALFMALVGVGVAITIASAALSNAKNSAANVIGGFLAVSVAIMIISSALSNLKDVKNLADSVIALAVIINVIGIMIAVLTTINSSSENSSLMAVGAAFIMISASMLILAFAVEKLASVFTDSGVTGALITMGVFLALVGGLGIAAAVIPGATKAFDAIGTAFLTAGIGAALVGVGILAVCAGIKMLAPAVGVLAISLGMLFTTLEEHKGAAIAVGVIFLAIVALVSVAIIQLEKAILSIAYTIASVFKKTGSTLDSGESKFHGWISNMSTKGKAALVAMITTLCAAIMKASPEILSTIGQLIIKVLSFLGSIAGDIAMGLLDFLINLINGLTDAIMANSARIAAALWGVVIALADVLWQIIGQLFATIGGAIFGEKAGNAVREFFGGTSEELMRMAQEQRKIAEEADKAKRDYLESVREVTGGVEDGTSKTTGLFDGLTNAFKKDSKEQKDELASLKEEYKDLPGYAYDAILRSKQSQYGAGVESGESAGNGILDGFDNIMSGENLDVSEYYDGSGLISEEYAIDGATTYTTTTAETVAEGSDEMAEATDEMMSGGTKAIEDNKENVKTTVKDNYVKPAQETVLDGHRGMKTAGDYMVKGAIDAIEQGQSGFCQAMVNLAKAGQKSFEEQEEIESPSKVFFQNGEYIVQGLINGIVQSTDGVTSTMGGLSNAILLAFGDPFEYLSKISSGELVYDPSVRPVFDGSGLYKGASSINSMLSQQTISVSGLSGKLAADIGSLDSTNADVVTELRALREDLSYMEDAIAEMQVVMDTGELVGVMSSPMDTALGRRAAYKQRGN